MSFGNDVAPVQKKEPTSKRGRARHFGDRSEMSFRFVKLEHQPPRLSDGDEIKSASGRSRVRQNAGLRREFQARVLECGGYLCPIP